MDGLHLRSDKGDYVDRQKLALAASHSFCFGFPRGDGKADQAETGNLGLQVLATQSGGLVLNASGVAELLQECVADTDAYYVISYAPVPAERPNEYHHIEVQVAKPGLIARTRQG